VLRIGILLSSPLEKDNAHSHELISTIRQAIEAAGHVCFIATKSAEHFHRNVERIRRHMRDCEADAWIAYSARRDVLEMVSAGPVPAFALGGQMMGLPMAGSRADLSVPISDCVDLRVDLNEHGHVQLARQFQIGTQPRRVLGHAILRRGDDRHADLQCRGAIRRAEFVAHIRQHLGGLVGGGDARVVVQQQIFLLGSVRSVGGEDRAGQQGDDQRERPLHEVRVHYFFRSFSMIGFSLLA
jgi:hypothetical protein